MPYVTNPYLIPHPSAAVTRQIIKTMETDWKQTLDQCFKHTGAATTAHLFTLSGFQTAEGRGEPSPECLGTQPPLPPHAVSASLTTRAYA